jgi:endogenous inhibitor of DNA gyrase (YacG/DUF329 family)
MPTTVLCPTCQAQVPWTPESRFRPFCSERCRLIDLGEWLTEGRVIPEPLDAYPAEDPDAPGDSGPRAH